MSIRRTFVLILWASIFAACAVSTTDPDLWWHLKTGEYIFKHGIPSVDVFSYTITGQSIIAHESLFQITLWFIYKLFGFPGIILASALFCVIILWIVYKACAGKPYVAAYTVLFILPIFIQFTATRPHLITAFMTALLVLLMEKVRSHGWNSKVFFLFPPLFLVWVNFHGGYVSGIAILLIYAIGESLQRLFKSPRSSCLSWQEIRRLLLSILFSFLITGLNPNGVHIWTYPFYQVAGHVQQLRVMEWQSPNFHFWGFWPFLLLAGFSMLAWIITEKVPTFTEFFLFLITLMASLVSVRHMIFFILVNAPMFSRYLLECFNHTWIYPELNGTSEELPVTRARTILHSSLVAIIMLASSAWIATIIADNDNEIGKACPVAAVDYIKEKGLDKKRVYNDYNFGSYLLWRDIPVFFDQRAEIYGDKFMKSYFKTLDLDRSWRDTLEKYSIDYLLLTPHRPLAVLLEDDLHWREIYRDHVAVIFIRNSL